MGRISHSPDDGRGGPSAPWATMKNHLNLEVLTPTGLWKAQPEKREASQSLPALFLIRLVEPLRGPRFPRLLQMTCIDSSRLSPSYLRSWVMCVTSLDLRESPRFGESIVKRLDRGQTGNLSSWAV